MTDQPKPERQDGDGLEYALGALRTIAASAHDTSAKQMAAFAQAGIDLATKGADHCAEMRGDPSPTRDGGEGVVMRHHANETLEEQEYLLQAAAPPKPAPDAMRQLADKVRFLHNRKILGPVMGGYQISDDECASIIAALSAPAQEIESESVFHDRMSDEAAALRHAPVPPASGPITTEQLDRLQFGRQLHTPPPCAGSADRRWLNDLIKATEAFRAAMVSSNVVGRYDKELRALESALDPLNYRSEAGAGEPLPKRPFAFAVKRAPENGDDTWRLFLDEAKAREAAEQLDGEYEALYRVGDRRAASNALKSTPCPHVTLAMEEAGREFARKNDPSTFAGIFEAMWNALLYVTPPVRGDREILEQCAKLARQFELDMSGSQLDDRDIENIQHGSNVASNAIADAILSLPVQPGAGEREAVIEECALVADAVVARAERLMNADPNSARMVLASVANGAMECAENIRALSSQAPLSSSEGGR